jgi:hypothetical protein
MARIASSTYVMGLSWAATFSHPLSSSMGTKVGARKVSGKKTKETPHAAAALPLPSAADTVNPAKPVPSRTARPMTAS